MYLVAIAWLYITVMMALAEAVSPGGSILGALITLVFYGLLPLSIVLYIMGTPARKRALRERDRAASTQPDAGRHASGAAQSSAVSAMREEP